MSTGMTESKKEIVSFRKEVASLFEHTLTERIKADCTIEELRVRFYPGQQLSLEVYPYVKHKGNKIESFFTFPKQTDNVLRGDDDYFIFPVSIPCEYDDELVVYTKNTDPNYDYNLSVDIVIDYLGGKQRVVEG